MAINKEALANLILNQRENQEFNLDSLTDEMLSGLFSDEEELIDNEEETQEAEESEEETQEDTVAEETSEENDEEIVFEGIDTTNLSPTEKMFYDHIIKEKHKAKQREISLLISGSQLDIKHKVILDRMAKDGVPRKSIEATIEDLKQIQASNARTKGLTKIVSKSKTKGIAPKTDPKNPTVPKFGTKEFGSYLAQLKNGKK
ncbi:MAG: hypothetical protein ACRC5T_08155 [Cetobacterium sp.]